MFSTLFGTDRREDLDGHKQREEELAPADGQEEAFRTQPQAVEGEAASSRYARLATHFWGRSRDQAQAAAEAARAAVQGEKAQELWATAQGAAAEAQQRTLEAAERVREGGYTAYAQLPSVTKDRLDFLALQEAGFGAVGAQLERRRAEAYDLLFVQTTPLRMQLMLALREMVKESAVADPEMPGCARVRIEMAVDRFWTDLIIYQEKRFEDAVHAAAGRVASTHAELAALGLAPLPGSPFWWRARILYHYLPFDKSIFGSLKDPVYLLLSVVSLVPYFGIRIAFFTTVLILIARGCPPDEYQLVSYILMFKGTQVFSSGIVMAIVAAVKFFICVRGNGEHTCATDGPGASEDIATSAVDFFGSSLLVWLAFVCLPCSSSSAGTRDLDGALEERDDLRGGLSDFTAHTQSDSGTDAEGGSRRFLRFCCCCCGGSRQLCRCCRRRWDPTRGGRLGGLLCWDLFSFALSCALLIFLADVDVTHSRPGGRPATPHNVTSVGGVEKTLLADAASWQFHTNVFMVRVFYAFLSLPYVVFMLPMLNGILTHTTPTGYNLQGICVPYVLPPMPAKKDA